jgi:hypothetical protein
LQARWYTANCLRPSGDPTSDQFEPNNPGSEVCLTTLNVLDSLGNPAYGKTGTVFSWNNVEYTAAYRAGLTDMYSIRGYFVEYGNLPSGDNSPEDYSYASANGTLIISETETPQTGDSSPLQLWWCFAAISAAGIGTLVLPKRKKAFRR